MTRHQCKAIVLLVILVTLFGCGGPQTHDSADAQVRQLMAEGRKIEAIKRYREIHDVGLAEAKAAVEALDK